MTGRSWTVDFRSTAATLDALPDLVRARIEYLGLSYREVGRQAGVSFSTVHRFVEGGNDPSFRAAKHLLRWLAATSDASEPTAISDDMGPITVSARDFDEMSGDARGTDG